MQKKYIFLDSNTFLCFLLAFALQKKSYQDRIFDINLDLSKHKQPAFCIFFSIFFLPSSIFFAFSIFGELKQLQSKFHSPGMKVFGEINFPIVHCSSSFNNQHSKQSNTNYTVFWKVYRSVQIRGRWDADYIKQKQAMESSKNKQFLG